MSRLLLAMSRASAEVSEQTVYNYFQTKEQLVTDLASVLPG